MYYSFVYTAKLLSKSQLTINEPVCINKSPSTHAVNFYLTPPDSDYKLCELKVLAEASLSATTSSYDLRQADTMSTSRLYSRRNSHSLSSLRSFQYGDKITGDMDKIDGKINHSCTRKYASCGTLDTTISSFSVGYPTCNKNSKKHFRRSYSLETLSIDDDQDGAYVIPLLHQDDQHREYFNMNSPSLHHDDEHEGYVEMSTSHQSSQDGILPVIMYEEIQDPHLYDEIKR